jgi:glyoxylase-like metal-dependent hydrolase (beta-lactamase superfamily II)
VRNDQVEQDQLFERLWTGDAAMEEWTAAVSGGSAKPITDSVIAIHTGYLFGNTSAVRTDAGLVLVDTGSRETASQTFAALRRWDDSPVHTVIYTHGHIDHSWGARLLDQEADAREIARPRIVAHRNVHNRFDRYDATHELNSLVMGRQFNQPGYTFPKEHRRPDQVYDDHLALMVGGVRIELFHGRGETDDATFVWLPEQRILVSGDFVIWVFPNAGNPRKVQRFAPDWAAALRRMEALKPEVHSVSAPADLLAKPHLLPKYDDPEFVVRNIWHLYKSSGRGITPSLSATPNLTRRSPASAPMASSITPTRGAPSPARSIICTAVAASISTTPTVT